MVPVDHLRQAIGRHVRIDLGRGDVGVAEQGLDDAEVGAALEQMGGEGVAQDVGADPGGVDVRAQCRLIQHLGEATGGQMAGGRA